MNDLKLRRLNELNSRLREDLVGGEEKKQSMNDLKLRRLNELNSRLREDLVGGEEKETVDE